MAKQKHPEPVKSEVEKELERLEEQVRHAEEHAGQYDTCHHEMLRRAKGETTPALRAGASEKIEEQ